MTKIMKTLLNIYANGSVSKLKEYSQSYGNEVVEFEGCYIFEYQNEIKIFDLFGRLLRTMKKGTKVLKSFTGTLISERTFKMRTKKFNIDFQNKIQAKKIADKENLDKFRAEMLKLYKFTQENWDLVKSLFNSGNLEEIIKLANFDSILKIENIKDALYNKKRAQILAENGMI
jgi:hypothetical protein